MNSNHLPVERVRALLDASRQRRILVLGDVMLDHFIWGNVTRISPEAPVPVVDFLRESYMPGGAANVARNLSALQVSTGLYGLIGQEPEGNRLRELLVEQRIDCRGLLARPGRLTTIKMRIVALQQQVVRLDRESRQATDPATLKALADALEPDLASADAVIVADYGKGVVTQPLLETLKTLCRPRGVWLSLDPKPVHTLDLQSLSLLTPNRREAFELAGLEDVPLSERPRNPLEDRALLHAAERLFEKLKPALLLITLGDQGMLLCQRHQDPFHIPTVAQEVFDVSGAGDTVIATFTMAIAAGASPTEAAILSNHAAGVVVGKMGTATVTPEELIASFSR